MKHDPDEPRDRQPDVGAEPEADSNTISPLPGEPGIPNVATRQRMAVSTKGLLAVVLLIGSLVAVAAGPPRARSTEVSMRSPIHCLSQDRNTVMGSDGIAASLQA
jgi:hypothetical protein